MKKKKTFLFLLCLSMVSLLLSGCAASGGPEAHQAEAAAQAVESNLLKAFFKSQKEAVTQLGLTEEMLVETEGESGAIYRDSYNWCGMKLDTTLAFGMGLPSMIRAKTTLPDDEDARRTAEDCVSLFQDQFGDPQAYTLGDERGAGTNYEYAQGAVEKAFQEYWKDRSDYPQLAFRFYLDGEKSGYEWVECRIVRSEEIELRCKVNRSVVRMMQDSGKLQSTP